MEKEEENVNILNIETSKVEPFINTIEDDELNDNNRNLIKIERTEAGYSLLVNRENIQEWKSSFITYFNNTEGYDVIEREIGQRIVNHPLASHPW